MPSSDETTVEPSDSAPSRVFQLPLAGVGFAAGLFAVTAGLHELLRFLGDPPVASTGFDLAGAFVLAAGGSTLALGALASLFDG